MCSGVGMCGGTVVACRAVLTSICNLSQVRLKHWGEHEVNYFLRKLSERLNEE